MLDARLVEIDIKKVGKYVKSDLFEQKNSFGTRKHWRLTVCFTKTTKQTVSQGENRIAKDVDLTALLRHHTPPCDSNHTSCDARMKWT
jgi:hypothetical protein